MTLMIDESDFAAESEMTAELMKILNAGIQRGNPIIKADRTSTN